MRLLRLNIENRCSRLIDRVPSCLLAHKRYDSPFVHQTEFSLRPVLFGIRVIHNGRIHEHAAVGENPVEISRQGAQIPEGIFSLILDNPVLNLFGKGIPIGFVEGELPALGVLLGEPFGRVSHSSWSHRCGIARCRRPLKQA